MVEAATQDLIYLSLIHICLLANVAQIALVKAELVVVVVILGLLAIVVHGGDGHTQLIDGGGVDLGQGDGHAVVAGLLDAGDVGSGGAGLDTLGVLGDVYKREGPGS